MKSATNIGEPFSHPRGIGAYLPQKAYTSPRTQSLDELERSYRDEIIEAPDVF